MTRFVLPLAPRGLHGAVKVWREPVMISTYLPGAADKNPMFLEKRVYQGSSGRVYPLAFTDRIAEEKTDHAWQAIHLENEFIRLMILPEIGGRIHVGLDKRNGYDFFYRQNVIKPALVGLAGPWISGGVEFNWPQHHRPSTMMPVETEIEQHADGSVTVWCSEHEPMNRMKGMHGVCLHPGRAVIELKVRLFNRTALTQTFLWWANVAARVHERYQSFFPPDVRYVADHAKRAMSRFPLCDDHYYGIGYGKRGASGVPAEEMPVRFIPGGEYAANDLSWYANIPVPTSYMAMGTRGAFFGGYDHGARAGLVHVANPHISPGKKQWTWGNQEFGYAWDRNLTDEDGPYIELMAGVYTDNQPDFSYLHPGETRTWSQYWYPIQEIGVAREANVEAAVSLRVEGGRVKVGVAATAALAEAEVVVECRGERVAREACELAPGRPMMLEAAMPAGAGEADLRVTVIAGGRKVIAYQPQREETAEVPPAAREPALPADVSSNEQLYLIGAHLEQYRHATRHPEAYWREAVRRDPTDSRCHQALGRWHLRRGEWEEAAAHFQQAIAAQTAYNPNPENGEAFYLLGITLRYLNRDEQAYRALYKATWNYAWQSAAFYVLAQIDCTRHDWPSALDHLDRCLRVNAEHLQARALRVMVLRKLGRAREAAELLAETQGMDRLDAWSRYLAGALEGVDGRMHLDVASDMAAAGFWREAIDLLELAPREAGDGIGPMIAYATAFLLAKAGDEAGAALEEARAAAPDYCFPARLEDILILQHALRARPNDARAAYYLGNLLYDRRRHEEAIALWENSARLDSSFSIVWRNLGIGHFNIRHDAAAALEAYERAFQANPRDGRLLYERDQLWKRVGKLPEARLQEIERHAPLARQRDDLSIEWCALYNQTGAPEKSLALLEGRRFQPWEGGEGLALGQHVRTHLALGRRAGAGGDWRGARAHFEAALGVPENLGEGRHLLSNASDVQYFLGVACAALGDAAAACGHWRLAAEARGDFQAMAVRSYSEMTYYSALALGALGREQESRSLLRNLRHYADELAKTPARIDYFATSLPTMLLFEDDLQQRQGRAARFLAAQAHLGLGAVAAGVRGLRQVLEEDPSHALAADLLVSCAAATQTAG